MYDGRLQFLPAPTSSLPRQQQQHHHNRSPPKAHSASSVPRRGGSPSPSFRSPLDLAMNKVGGDPTDGGVALLADANYGGMYGRAATTDPLAGITAPPAIPPPSSKFWDTPPPNFPSLASAAAALSAAAAASSSGRAPQPLQSAQAVSSLSAASASPSQFEAATGARDALLHPLQQQQASKYSQLLAVLEEMGKDIRPSYAGSKSSAERLKRGIGHARHLVREALIEVERASRQ